MKNEAFFKLYRTAKEKLATAGIPSYEFEAKQLARAVCNDGGTDRLLELISRRIKGEPLQYLLGEWEFYGITLKTDRRALIPRADTETLAEVGISFIKSRHLPNPNIIDLCSGTGCVAFAIAKKTGRQVTALEKFPEAFSLLKENTALLKLPVTPVLGDVFCGTDEKFDLIVSNPPYINTADIPSLQKEVSFEPASALDGGADGLRFYRALSQKWAPALNPGGMLAVEIGINEESAVAELFENAGLTDIKFYRDIPGIIRVVSGIMP